MINQELLKYVNDRIKEGVSDENITNALIKNGWTKNDVDNAFAELRPVASMPSFRSTTTASIPAQENIISVTTSQEQSAAAQQSISQFQQTVQPQQNIKLRGVMSLFSGAWRLLVSRFFTILGIYFIIVIAFSLLGAGFIFSGLVEFSPLFFIPYIIIVIIFILWYQVTYFFAVAFSEGEEKIGIIESYRRGFKKIPSYLWASILYSLIYFAVVILAVIPILFLANLISFLFLLLLPLVAIVMLVLFIWFFLFPFVLVSENTKGLDALMKSREYVRGIWWGILGRFIAIFILLLVVLSLSNLLLMIPVESLILPLTIIAVIIQFLVTIFATFFMFLLYKSAKETKRNLEYNPQKGRTKFIVILWLIFIIAVVVPIIIIILNLDTVLEFSSFLLIHNPLF